jgi:DNA/RNA-binding domain of Phe-tRNA-synthetase-like protein
VTIETGWVDAELQEEFPELRLRWIVHEGGSGRTPPEIKERLRGLSDRYTGGKAVHLRQEPIPWAYRVFFRQVGIDPDDHRTPAEQAALDRMKHGSFRSRNLLDDALVIATVETGVPVMALDADRVTPPIGLRLSLEGERLGSEDGRPLSVRQIVIADPDRSVAVLFGDIAEERGVDPGTSRMLVCSVQVKGVPEISVEEALWTVTEVLRTGA